MRNLQLPPQEETDTLAQLTKWQCTGIKLKSSSAFIEREFTELEHLMIIFLISDQNHML